MFRNNVNDFKAFKKLMTKCGFFKYVKSKTRAKDARVKKTMISTLKKLVKHWQEINCHRYFYIIILFSMDSDISLPGFNMMYKKEYFSTINMNIITQILLLVT